MVLRKTLFPFYLIYLTFILSFIIEQTGSNVFVWLPELLLILTLFLEKIKFKKGPMLIMCVFLILKDILYADKLHSASIVSIVITTTIIYSLINKYKLTFISELYIKNITYFLFFSFMFILLEIYNFKLGGNFISFFFAGNYKPNFSELYGEIPQSIYNGSQAGAQMTMYFLFWLLLLLKNNSCHNHSKPTILILCVLCSLVLISYPNTTILITLIFSLLIYSKDFIQYKRNRIWAFFIGVVIFIIGLPMIVNILSYKILSTSGTLLSAYYDPIYQFQTIGVFEKLVGMKGIDLIDVAADFGLGLNLIRLGLIFFLFFLFWIIRNWYLHTIKIDTKQLESTNLNRKIILLNQFSSIIVFSSMISLLHYSVALNFGGRLILSFSIALLLFTSVNRAKTFFDVK